MLAGLSNTLTPIKKHGHPVLFNLLFAPLAG